MKRIMVDVDGVMADFVLSFTTLANERLGKDIVRNHDTSEWDFGYSELELLTLWNEVRHTYGWWTTLEPLITPVEFGRLNELNKRAHVYFVTSRVHDTHSPAWQTAAWLDRHGVRHPSVVVSPYKAAIAGAIRAHISIEDNYDNWKGIHSCLTSSYLLDRRYNRGDDMEVPTGLRLFTFSEFLDIAEDLCHTG